MKGWCEMFGKKKEHKFCKLDWNEMDDVLKTLLELIDGVEMTDAGLNAMDIAIECVSEVKNRMKDNRKIVWDE